MSLIEEVIDSLVEESKNEERLRGLAESGNFPYDYAKEYEKAKKQVLARKVQLLDMIDQVSSG